MLGHTTFAQAPFSAVGGRTIKVILNSVATTSAAINVYVNRLYLKVINTTTASSASFIKGISRVIASSTNAIATESKSTGRALTAVLTTSAFISRITLRLVITVVDTSAAVVKNTLKTINSVTSTASSIIRAVSKPIVAVVMPITSVDLTKIQFKTLEVILTTGAIVGLITSHFKTLIAALHTNSYLYKAVIKMINSVTNIASSFSMGVRRTLTALVTTGAFVGLITSHFKTLLSVVTTGVFTVRLAHKTLIAALHTNSYLYKAVIKMINSVTNIASAVRKTAIKTITALVTIGAFVGRITSHFKTLLASVETSAFIHKLALKTLATVSVLTASATKRIASTKKASVVIVSRNIVLAFFIGIRKLSLHYIQVFSRSPIYISPETTTTVVPQEYRSITVPPEDTENV